MGLPWFRFYSEMPVHPKSDALAIATGDERAWTHVVQLWCWAAQHRSDGDLSSMTDALIGMRAGITPKGADAFAKSLRACGWIDPNGHLHDWADEQAAHVKVRERERAKKARQRVPKEMSRGTGAGTKQGTDGGTQAGTDKGTAGGMSPRDVRGDPLSTLDLRSEIGDVRERTSASFTPDKPTDKEEPPPIEDDPPLAPPVGEEDRSGSVAGTTVEAPRREIAPVPAPTPVPATIVQPDASAGPSVVPGESYPPGGWTGCPATSAGRMALLKSAYSLLATKFDHERTWPEWDNWHIPDKLAKALRDHPLKTAPDPYVCLTEEVVSGYEGHFLTQPGTGNDLAVLLRPANLQRAMSAGRAKAKGIDPNARPSREAPKPKHVPAKAWVDPDAGRVVPRRTADSPVPEFLRAEREHAKRKLAGESK